jgi:glycosyltransferase involved in cell wall biosynthesis
MIVSVVTPTLNAMEYLGECVESTRRQTTDNIDVEHVVVDGGSTDGTVEFAQSQGCVVMTGKDDGIFDAINKGSFNSSGVLIGFLGADDALLPGALGAVVGAYERYQARWLVGRVRWTDARGAVRGDLSAPPSWVTASMLASLGWNCIPHTSTYMHRELFEQLGGFDKSFRYSGDYDFFVRARHRDAFLRIPRALSCFRRHGQNMSMRMDAAQLAENEAVAQRFGPSARWQYLAYRYLIKLWLNGENLPWSVRKRLDAARALTR